jgi:hypothetical protein
MKKALQARKNYIGLQGIVVITREGGDPVFQLYFLVDREATAYWILRWSLSSGSPKARPDGGV